MEEIFNRIKEGYFFNKNLVQYTIVDIDNLLDYLISEDRFEDCVLVKKFSTSFFDHNFNYKNIFNKKSLIE